MTGEARGGASDATAARRTDSPLRAPPAAAHRQCIAALCCWAAPQPCAAGSAITATEAVVKEESCRGCWGRGSGVARAMGTACSYPIVSGGHCDRCGRAEHACHAHSRTTQAKPRIVATCSDAGCTHLASSSTLRRRTPWAFPGPSHHTPQAPLARSEHAWVMAHHACRSQVTRSGQTQGGSQPTGEARFEGRGDSTNCCRELPFSATLPAYRWCSAWWRHAHHWQWGAVGAPSYKYCMAVHTA